MQTKQGLLAYVVIAGAIVITILLIAVVAIPSRKANTPTANDVDVENITENNASETGTNPDRQTTKINTQTTVIKNQPAQGITVISPSANDKLVLGQNHTISWSEKGGFKGYIYLADASTKEIVGWINSETGPQQTSYTWDTQNLFLSRYSPNKKTVEPGNYVIGVGFESKQTPTTSGMFEIIYPSQATVVEHNITTNNFYASPDSLSVKKGDKLIFSNQDSEVIDMAIGSIKFSISPGGNYTFDTSALFPGEYNFYAENYSTLKIRVTVQ